MTRVYPDWLPPETFAQRVQRLRTERGLSLRDVQRLSGIQFTMIQRVEHGEDMMLSNMAKLARAFDMTPSELIAGLTFADGSR